MNPDQKMPIIGILGGIGSGKSTVAKELGKLGCGVIEADKIAKELLGENEVKLQLRSLFGDSIFDQKGEVDRKKLSDVVFDDAQLLSKLNSIIHPRVFQRTEQLISDYQSEKTVKAVVLDIPLLAETGWEKRCDKLIFVACDEKIRAKRLQKKGVLSKNELKKRENFQISLDKKEEISDYVVRNETDLLELIEQIGKIFPGLTDNC